MDKIRCRLCVGYADVIKNKTIYELKLVSELTHEHFLQCACYVVAKTITKHQLSKYYKPKGGTAWLKDLQ